MRVLCWNIQHLEVYEAGVDPHAEFERALVQAQADVVLLQEVDRDQERSGNVDQTALAASILGTANSQFVVTPPAAGNYGIAMAVRTQVLQWNSKLLTGSPVGMWLTFMMGGKPTRFYVKDHTRAVMTAQLSNGWLVANMHASFVPGWAHLMVWRAARWAKAEARRTGSRLLFCGDLNLASHRFLRLCGLRSLTNGLTFPAWAPNQQIDHVCVVSSDHAEAEAQLMDMGISDHLALVVEID